MVEIRIECPCGQHYAFDVEPVSGRTPSTVNCPSCGANGTDAANEIITLKSSTVVKPTITRLAVHSAPPVTAPGIHRDVHSLGLVPREQAEIDARAKISWGDEPGEVIKYLMLQGFHAAEAKELVDDFYKERLATVRTTGLKKIGYGASLMCTPVITFLTFGLISSKLLGVAILVGLYGAYLVINGTIMTIAPKMESGDVAEE